MHRQMKIFPFRFPLMYLILKQILFFISPSRSLRHKPRLPWLKMHTNYDPNIYITNVSNHLMSCQNHIKVYLDFHRKKFKFVSFHWIKFWLLRKILILSIIIVQTSVFQGKMVCSKKRIHMYTFFWQLPIGKIAS